MECTDLVMRTYEMIFWMIYDEESTDMITDSTWRFNKKSIESDRDLIEKYFLDPKRNQMLSQLQKCEMLLTEKRKFGSLI